MPRVPAAESRVLQVLWDRPSLSAREITEVLYAQTTPTEIGTVQKLLQRLEAKALVRRDRSRHIHRFSAALPREDFVARQLEGVFEMLAEGSLIPVLTQLVQSKGLSPAQRKELRRLLDEHPPESRRGAK